MNSTGVLDDYLDELLGEAIAVASPAVPPLASTGSRPASTAAPEREPTWDDLPAEVIYETETVAAAPAMDDAALEAAFEAASAPGSAGPRPASAAEPEREPTWDDLPAEVIYETETVAATPAVDDAALEATFEAASAPGSAGPRPASTTAPQREPTWDDLPDEVIHETAPAPTPATATSAPEPTWDDLPDEVIYETDPADSHRLAHTDSPGLQAAFEAAAGGEDVPTPPPAAVAALAPAPRPTAAPAAAAPPPRVAVDAPSGNRPGTWQELPAAHIRRTAAPASAPRAGCACVVVPRPMHWNC